MTFFLGAVLTLPAFAIGGPTYVSTSPASHAFPLVEHGKAPAIVVDPADWPGVVRAAGDLRGDIQRVSGVLPALDKRASAIPARDVVLIGTVGRSALIDDLIRRGKLNVADVRGTWESGVTTVIDRPFPGVAHALVIAGSDKRGTIFAIYDLSEQIGVSPWYWWADVRIPHHDQLFVLPGRNVQPVPAVMYRGIFLNDEAPALTGWAKEKFGNLNSQFYAHVFELLLRLKANYLWPAMWGNAFNEDDPENPKMADLYGVVMGTSHHEPMLRAQQEWKRHGIGPWDYATNGAELRKFWTEGIERNKDYESSITLGMRGDGDMAMSKTNNVALLEKIVHDQRLILDSVKSPVLKNDLKVWALYKEVQGYYEDGMRVPDDVTLLWSDDNWGDIRRLPTPAERSRSGGAGIYYHFDYVGGPRNYKWINTNPIPKIWEQMHLALAYGADRLWVVNVGDLKPMEIPIEFFLSYARTPQYWNNTNLHQFLVDWATRDFGPEHANAIARCVEDYTRYNGRRKPELLSPHTFSVVNFDEADRVEAEWDDLVHRTRTLAAELPASEKASFFELVQYPVEASATVTEMYIAAGKNALAAEQGRPSANAEAARTKQLFDQDAALTNEYNHDLLNGRWDHMMDQTRIGYTGWQEPPKNVMPAVRTLDLPEQGALKVAVGSETGPALSLGEFDSVARQSRAVTLFDTGASAVPYQVQTSAPWIRLGDTHAPLAGTLIGEKTIPITIDWAAAPQDTASGSIEVSSGTASVAKITLTAKRQSVTRADAAGFVESDGLIAIEAAHTSATTTDGDVHWAEIPGYGRTVSAMTTFPVTSPSNLYSSAGLDYTIRTDDSGAFTLSLVLAPTLNFVPGRGLRLAVSVDDGPRVLVDALQHNTEREWAKAVSDAVKQVDVPLAIATTGEHTLHLWYVDPGVVVERLVLSHGPVPPTYLGPPESFHS